MRERLVSIVGRFPERNVLIIGDAIADQFVYGAISRVSREAPVFILQHEHTETMPGGAANCAVNLASLGASVSLVSAISTDEAGRALVERLKIAGVTDRALLITEKLRTTTKVRILAGQQHSTRQQVIRIDYEGKSLEDDDLRHQLREHLREHVEHANALIISDYNYGLVDTETATLARDLAQSRRIPIVADSRFQLSSFPGMTAATPNQSEVEQLLDTALGTRDELESAGEALRKRLGYRALLVTRGSQGMILLKEGVPPLHLDAIGGREPVDVTGAGDTVIATFTLALASDATFSDAAQLANYAGGLVVMKRGTGSVTADELIASVRSWG